MKLRLTGTAKKDIQKISLWIAEENPVRAKSFARELNEACEKLIEFPEAYLPIGIFGTKSVRRKPYGNYLIFYRIIDNRLEVLRILHGAQDYSDLF
jgi:toxin ParE1/3/4